MATSGSSSTVATAVGITAAAAVVAVLAVPSLREGAGQLWHTLLHGDEEGRKGRIARKQLAAIALNVDAANEICDDVSKQARDALEAAAVARRVLRERAEAKRKAADDRARAEAASKARAEAAAVAEADAADAAAAAAAAAGEDGGDTKAADGDGDAGDSKAGADGKAPGDKDCGYYFFTSDGRRIKSKWDSFDVDAELERMDAEETGGGGGKGNGNGKLKGGADPVAGATEALTAAQRAVAQADHDFTKVLKQLDAVRAEGDNKGVRKTQVDRTLALCGKLDDLKGELQESLSGLQAAQRKA